jgi:hypothetical protein
VRRKCSDAELQHMAGQQQQQQQLAWSSDIVDPASPVQPCSSGCQDKYCVPSSCRCMLKQLKLKRFTCCRLHLLLDTCAPVCHVCRFCHSGGS